MINITICDEDDKDRSMLAEQCKRYISEHDTRIDLKVYASWKEVQVVEETVDILILDVTSQETENIRIKEELEMQDRLTYIICVSEHDLPDEMVGTNVSAFVRKPIVYDRLCKEIDKILHIKERDENIIFLNRISDVEYVESDKPYVVLHYVGGNTKSERISLVQFERKAGELFVRTSRKYLVNLTYVKNVSEKVLMNSGTYIEVSRDAKAELKRRYKSYLQKIH